MLAGGVLGFLLSLPLGWMSAAPPGVAALLLGLPLAAAVAALLSGWIRDGRMPELLPAVAVVVLLVDLLAAGGIGVPSVAGTLWLLLALGLCGRQPRMLPSYSAWSALAIAIAAAVLCYTTAYRPVLECQANMRLAERDPVRAVEHLAAAAVADPLSAEPWRQLAAIEFERWRQQPSDEAFRRFERCNATVLELSPNSATAHLAAGDWYLQAFRHEGCAGRNGWNPTPSVRRSTPIAKPPGCIPTVRSARQNWPRSTGRRATRVAFRQEAESALRLDEATPHLDKKLPAELRNRLSRGRPDPS